MNVETSAFFNNLIDVHMKTLKRRKKNIENLGRYINLPKRDSSMDRATEHRRRKEEKQEIQHKFTLNKQQAFYFEQKKKSQPTAHYQSNIPENNSSKRLLKSFYRKSNKFTEKASPETQSQARVRHLELHAQSKPIKGLNSPCETKRLWDKRWILPKKFTPFDNHEQNTIDDILQNFTHTKSQKHANIQNKASQSPKRGTTSPRMAFRKINGRKMNNWRYQLGLKSGLFQKDIDKKSSPSFHIGQPQVRPPIEEEHFQNSMVKTMTSRFARTRKINLKELEKYKKNQETQKVSKSIDMIPQVQMTTDFMNTYFDFKRNKIWSKNRKVKSTGKASKLTMGIKLYLSQYRKQF
ncbi:unnamed protein product [Moneuplotes crassus]|uniref:Uncharacterized protein n=1 Tax=Euplotes crassus TaxID=5936 RepID=A0AAD1XGS7_EUPCR|nr:unnamed protein product [Moneuplotes crassus]